MPCDISLSFVEDKHSGTLELSLPFTYASLSHGPPFSLTLPIPSLKSFHLHSVLWNCRSWRRGAGRGGAGPSLLHPSTAEKQQTDMPSVSVKEAC